LEVVGAQALGDEAEEGLADLQGGREGGREGGRGESIYHTQKEGTKEGGREGRGESEVVGAEALGDEAEEGLVDLQGREGGREGGKVGIK